MSCPNETRTLSRSWFAWQFFFGTCQVATRLNCSTNRWSWRERYKNRGARKNVKIFISLARFREHVDHRRPLFSLPIGLSREASAIPLSPAMIIYLPLEEISLICANLYLPGIPEVR